MIKKLTQLDVDNIRGKYSYLINYQADDADSPIDPLGYVDSNGDGLIHIAAAAGDALTVELLLSAGIDPDQLGDMGCTALHYARMRDRHDVVKLLLAYGAQTDIENEFGEKSGDE